MLPVIVWSVLVYAAVATLALLLAHRWIERVNLPEALLLAALPLLFTGRATATGGVYAPLDILFHFEPFASQARQAGIHGVQTPVLSDVVQSMIPWQAAVRDALIHGRAPLWNRHVLGGEPLIAVQQGAVLHPGTWLALLLPPAQGWTFQMSLRLFLALLSAFLFLRDLRCGRIAALLGAAGWGLSEFILFWVGYPVTTAAAAFPLLLLGLSRLVRDADARAVVLTVLALFLLITPGHPEMLLYAVVAAGVDFLFLLAWAGRGRRLRPFLLSLAAGALALGLTAVQLAPLAEALPHTWEHGLRSEWYAHVRKSVEPLDSAQRLVQTFLPFAFEKPGGGTTRDNYPTPGGYAGIALLPLAAVGVAGGGRRRFALLTLGVLGIVLATRARGVSDAVFALPLFDIAQTNYLVYLVPFAVAALAALGVDRLSRREGLGTFLGASLASLVLLLALAPRLLPGIAQLEPGTVRRRVIWEAVALAVCALVVVVAWMRRAHWGGAALLAVLVASRVGESGDLYPTVPRAAFYPKLPVLDAVPRDRPVRFVAVGQSFLPNVAAVYGIEDARGYESMTLRSLYETFPLWCEPQPAWFNRVDDLARPFLSFLNVGYALVPRSAVPPEGWTLVTRDAGGDLLENRRVIPRVFVPERLCAETDRDRRLTILAGISDFRERGVVDEPSTAPPATWRPNGSATVTLRAYRAQSMSLEVDAESAAVIGTSIPAWPGWRARLDDRPASPLTFNNAFLAFRVPPGKHRLDLDYLPRSFVWGAWVSALTAGLCAALWLWGARRVRARARERVLSSPAPP